ncbi:Splicing factor [Salvia divinorum]|uniref:Splicing factor n=1 Tax=Salvia divinorum TaxID=28513 RepID=A0ABD1IGW4_SALDI
MSPNVTKRSVFEFCPQVGKVGVDYHKRDIVFRYYGYCPQALNSQSRAMLMAKLDSSVIAPSVVGTLGVPALNGAAPTQQAITMPINPTAVLPNAVLPPQVFPWLQNLSKHPVNVCCC